MQLLTKLIILLAIMLWVVSCTSSQDEAIDDPAPDVSATHDSLLARVPLAAQAYINAVNQNNLDDLVNAFDANGRIIDVTRNIDGHSAIRTWARNEVMGGNLRVLEIDRQTQDSVRLLVHWAPRGSAGWRAWYSFTYTNGRITIADLQYA